MTELTRVSSLRRISSSRTAMRKLARTGHSFTRLPSKLSTNNRPVKKNNLNVLIEETIFVDKSVLQDATSILIKESTFIDEYGFDTTADVADDSSVKTSKVKNSDAAADTPISASAVSSPPSLTKESNTSLRRVGSKTAMKHRAVSLARNGSRLTRRTGSRLNRTGSRFNHTVRRAISPTTKLPTSQEEQPQSEGGGLLLSEEERAKLWNDVDQLVVNESLLLMNDNNNQSKEEYDIPIWFKNDSMDGLVSVKTNPTIEEESDEDIVKKEEMNVVVEDCENQDGSGSSSSTSFFSCGGGLDDVWSCIRIDGVVLDDNATDEGVTNDIAMDEDEDTPVSEVVQDENKQVLDNISSSINNNNENTKYWKQMVDGTTSKTYYYNKKTNEVSWTQPLGYGNETWKIAKDTTTGKTYYYNKQTKMVQWDKPDVLFKNGKEDDEVVMSVEKKEEGWGWSKVNTFGGILSSRMY